MEALFTTITFEKPPGVGAPNGFRYTPEGYPIDKFIVSSPGAVCKRFFADCYFHTLSKEDDTMKIEKLPSGSYRIRKMYKGQMYTVTFDAKPSQKEAMLAMAAELEKVQEKHQTMSFQTAGAEYIAAKRNVLSPTTIRGYGSAMRTISKEFLQKNIYDITALDIQAEVNRLAESRSPKTVRNHHGFISAVMGTDF